MATDYGKLATDVKGIVDGLGIQRGDIQQLFGTDGQNPKVQAAMDEVDKLTKALQNAVTTEITEEERQRKLADLEAKIGLARITQATDPDVNDRIEAEHDLTVLLAVKATYLQANILRIGDLIDQDNHSLKSLLAQAQTEIGARQNLSRVLKGIQIVLQVGAFAGAVAAKLAIAA
jgi:hypothetical protein